MSALASLLVLLASNDGDVEHDPTKNLERAPTGTGTDGTTDSAEIRLALCTSAKRKACALFSYRSTIIRWTSKPTSNIRVQQRCERFASREKCNSCHSSGESDSSEFLRGDLLRLAWGETQGRFLAADMAIPAGTVLIKERPFSWCIEPPYATDFCGHCLCERKGCAVSCTVCGLTAFCSTACASAAREEWHKDECLDPSGDPLEPALSGLSTRCRVALRAVRRSGRKLRDKLGEHDASQNSGSTRGLIAEGCPPAANGRKLHIDFADLQEHCKEREALKLDLLETEAAVAAVLAYGCGRDRLIPNSPHRRVRKRGGGEEGACGNLAAEIAVASCKVSTNGFFISALRSTETAGSKVEALSHARIAVGVYRWAAMFNHSCRPNAVTKFHGGELVVVAARAINTGEPVTISYGPLASKVSSTAQRRQFLRDAYFFRCDCSACHPRRHGFCNDEAAGRNHDTLVEKTDFACIVEGCSGSLLYTPKPTSDDTPATVRQTRTYVWCSSCKKPISPVDFFALLSEAEEDARRWKKACDIAPDGGSLCDDHQRRTSKGGNAADLVLQCVHWRDRRLNQDAMQRAEGHDLMARLLVNKGEFRDAAKHCELSLQVLERRFAPEDQELGLELSKLANLCFQAGLMDQCVEACRKARISLQLCLPEGDEQLVALDVMETLSSQADHKLVPL